MTKTERLPGPPDRTEAMPYFYKYIDLVPGPDVVSILEAQLDDTVKLYRGISEERSLHRYEPGKWSIRQLANHISDTERVMMFRAFWFARGFDSPLPSFDEGPSADAARADETPWADHVEEFRAVRLATTAFLRNLPPEAWTRSGIASGNPISVRALTYLAAGHLVHHRTILEERYS